MATKRVQIKSEVVSNIETAYGQDVVKLKDYFEECVNNLIEKGLKNPKISADNESLLDIIMQTAEKINKVDEINEKLKTFLKELGSNIFKEL